MKVPIGTVLSAERCAKGVTGRAVGGKERTVLLLARDHGRGTVYSHAALDDFARQVCGKSVSAPVEDL